MKSIITSLAIFAIAVSTQAASLTWNLAGVKNPADSSATAPDGWLAYLLEGEPSSALTTALAKGDFSVLSSPFASGKTASGNVKGKVENALSAGQSFTGFVVVLDSASQSTAKNFIVSNKASKTVNAAGSDITIGFGNVSSSAYSAWSQISSVPEPATGALALAGIALLFRRKKA